MATAKELLTNLADSIRAKSGVTGTLSLAQMKIAVDGITTGITLPTLTTPAEAADVLNGKQYINASGTVVTGTMPVLVEGAVVLSKTILDHKINAQISYSGYAPEGLLIASIPLQNKTVTPTASQQRITADTSYYGLDRVTITGDANLVAANIKNGISIFGITGTFTSDATAVASDILDGKTAYVNGSKITGTMTNRGEITATIDGINTTSYAILKGYYSGGTVSLTNDIAMRISAVNGTTPDNYVISTELETLEALRNELRIHLLGMDLVDAGADLETCVEALQTVRSHGYTFWTISAPDETISIESGYYPDGSIVGLHPNEAEKIDPSNIRPGVTILGVEGSYTSDATAQSVDILEGVNAYARGVKITGTLKKQAKTVTPTKEVQTVTPDPGNLLSVVSVGAIPASYFDISTTTATASDVLAGNQFVSSDGVLTEGTMAAVGDVQAVLDSKNLTYNIPQGYHSGNGSVSVNVETRSASPAKSARTYTPSDGKLYSSFTVEAIGDNYQDITVTTLSPDFAISGSRFIGSDGTLKTGSMPNRGKVTVTIDGISTTSYTIPNGYHNGNGTVSLTSDIEQILMSI